MFLVRLNFFNCGICFLKFFCGQSSFCFICIVNFHKILLYDIIFLKRSCENISCFIEKNFVTNVKINNNRFHEAVLVNMLNDMSFCYNMFSSVTLSDEL
jgi:hypothetical protein